MALTGCQRVFRCRASGESSPPLSQSGSSKRGPALEVCWPSFVACQAAGLPLIGFGSTVSRIQPSLACPKGYHCGEQDHLTFSPIGTIIRIVYVYLYGEVA
jgi:hypothetical protein